MPLIIWGFKKTEQKMGYVADFCPICREIRPLAIYDVREVPHVYYLKLGKGKALGYIGKCQVCGVSIPVDPKRYKDLLNHQVPDIERLIELTYPRVRIARAGRLEIERRIKAHEPVSLQERRALLREPFMLLAGQIEEVFRQTPLDKENKIGLLVLFGLASILGCVTLAFADQASEVSMIAGGWLLLVIGLGVIYLLSQAFLTPRRIVRRDIMPLLVRALAPLRPTQQELEEVLSEMKTKGAKIGKVVKAEVVYAEITKRQHTHSASGDWV